MNIKDNIQRFAADYHQEVIGIRRHLHQFPELSFEEKATGQFIANALAEMEIPHQQGWAENGVVAIIQGKNPEKKTIALRADIDALPIQEANEVAYKSKHTGIMHACGHDVHTASLLGSAKILHQLRHHFEGQIKLIFQPAEEKAPGGASILIKEGVLENPAPVSILGQHVHPPLEVGKIGIKAGMFMASTDEIYVTITGKGGHGATPHQCVDPVLIASHMVVALQQIVSRNGDPTMPSVLTFGYIASQGGANNVIPNTVRLEGTFRTMDEQWRKTAHQKMKKMAIAIAEGMGGICEFNIVAGYPFLVNEEHLTARVRTFAEDYLGKEQVVDLPIRMTGEDFAFYTQEIPGCFYRLGVRNEAKQITSSVHTNTFDVDEDCLLHGMGLMAWLAIKELGN
jgi:amidohydrolase